MPAALEPVATDVAIPDAMVKINPNMSPVVIDSPLFNLATFLQ